MCSYTPRHKLPVPALAAFQFPFTPYDIQQQLMEAMFLVLEEQRVGIFESPTGTGKSLTLTCGALCWLEQHEAAVREDLHAHILEVQQEIQRLEVAGAECNDWISTQYSAKKHRDELFELRQLSELLAEQETRLQQMRESVKEQQQKLKKEKLKQIQNNTEKTSDDWEKKISDEMTAEGMDEMDEDVDTNADEQQERARAYRGVQIFYCSRTHTQLAQVLREVRRTEFGRRIRCVTLASRQQLCIHPQLRKLTNGALINERCLDMAQAKSGSGGSCSCKRPTAMQSLTATALCSPLDIEDLVREGVQTQACPYYAARGSISDAQLVLLPYQLLLHRRTRQQSGIDLGGAVVIIDEAHNLLDTIAQLHSCEISLVQLQLCHHQISAYKQQYATRFRSAKPLLRINQLLYVLKRLIKLLEALGKQTTTSRLLRTYDVGAEGEFYNIDLFELLAFCERTRFAQKLQGHAQRQQNENVPPRNEEATNSTLSLLQRLQEEHKQNKCKRKSTTSTLREEREEQQPRRFASHSITSPIRQVLSFLGVLTEPADDGRVLMHSVAGESSFKYLLLNPGAHFQEILQQTRAIIIAGGTMQPTTELTTQLFPSCPTRVSLHVYDHVVPATSVMAFAVAAGPSGQTLRFNYAQRGSKEMLAEVSMILQNVCNVVPAGVVCFLPSYDYLDTVYAHLEASGVLNAISQKKKVFREPRSAAVGGPNVEQLLADYAASISGGSQGALMLSVVGGKLSEGLNFADDLGRGVIVVGMPYPNRNSPELQERMRYLDATIGAGSGSEYYENLCMKAVNQCIGRSLRHIKDYACVFLLDERYSGERIQQKLPQWILRSLLRPKTFGAMQAATVQFFKQKRLSKQESGKSCNNLN